MPVYIEKINDKLEKLEKFTPLATNFTLPPALTGWTNSTSDLSSGSLQDAAPPPPGDHLLRILLEHYPWR